MVPSGAYGEGGLLKCVEARIQERARKLGCASNQGLEAPIVVYNDPARYSQLARGYEEADRRTPGVPPPVAEAEPEEFEHAMEDVAPTSETPVQPAADAQSGIELIRSASLCEEQQAQICALDEELTLVKAELENERQLRITEESDRREHKCIEILENNDAICDQLTELANLVIQQREEIGVKRKPALKKKEPPEQRIPPYKKSLLSWLACGKRWANWWLLSVICVSGERQTAIRAQCTEQHERTMEAVRATAHDWILFNVQECLEEHQEKCTNLHMSR
ncbi:predicted protein [Postia placenta Mad-698-R]|nr:predicted protein [Postia placenta Mad-698-R]